MASKVFRYLFQPKSPMREKIRYRVPLVMADLHRDISIVFQMGRRTRRDNPVGVKTVRTAIERPAGIEQPHFRGKRLYH